MKRFFIFIIISLAFTSCKTTDTSSEETDYVNSKNERILALEQIINDLESQIGVKEEELRILEERIDVLQNENSLLQSVSDNTNEENKKAIENLHTEIQAMIDEQNRLLEEIHKLEAESEMEKKRISSMADKLKSSLSEEIQNGDVQITQIDEVLVISITSSVLFDPDSSELKEEFKPVLVQLAKRLKDAPDKIVRVEGYTASAKVNRVDSWQLGADRAVTVLRFLQESGKIDPLRLVAVSYGEYRPVASNEDENEKVKNRRVQIVLVDRPVYQL